MTSVEKEDKLIISRACDALKIAERSYCGKAVGFLTPHGRALIMKNIFPPQDIPVVFEGGYPEAERTLFVCIPEYSQEKATDFLRIIEVSGRELGGLTHRDYLGSLMGLGITRENIGDILVGDNGAFVFVKTEIADYIKDNLIKIGKRGVRCEIKDCSEADIPKPKTREIKGTVSSLRLDAVLSLAAGVSRARAAEYINQGLISVNFEEAVSVSAAVNEGDLISARGVGRMRLEHIGGRTRKDRTGVTITKFE